LSFWPTLAGNSSAEIRYARLKNKIGEDIASKLARPFPKGGHVALQRDDLIAELGENLFEEQAVQTAQRVPALSPGLGHSNNWVISGDKSKSGAAMLANDPHLGLTTPGVWYLARLSYDNQTIRGVTIPGIPGVIIGRNNQISWGFTTTTADNEDVYIERLNKDNPEQYMTPSGWQTFNAREETFKVRFSDEVTRTIKSSRHGPILPQELLSEGAQLEGSVLAISSVAHQKTDLTMSFFIQMNHAKNLDDVNSAAPFYSLPTHNMVVADIAGNIGYFMVGATPLRGENHQSKGAFPVDGSVAENDWLGLVPYDERPRVRNPLGGQIITANGQVTPEGYKHNITSNWQDPGRAHRIEQQMNNYEKHDVESFSQMQLDVGSTKTSSMLNILKQAEPTRELDKRALSLLNSWDGAYSDDAPQPAIYAAWTMALSDKIYEDELGQLFQDYRGRRHQVIRDAFTGNLSSWCDDSRTQTVESCSDLLAPSLSMAMDGLTKEYGSDIENWRWREQLTIRHSHLGLGSFPVVGDIFSREIHKSGGPSSPDVTYWQEKALPRIEGRSHGASLRMITDMAEQNASRFIISSGQSGHFKSPHYDDLQQLWAEGKYIEIALDNAQVKAQHRFKIIAE
jgi:penicillin amidase